LRRVLIAVGALAVFAVAGLAGYAVSSRLAPERVRIALEDVLGRELGPVAVGRVRPFFAWGVGVEVAGLRSTGESDAGFAADRVWVTLSARSVLRGEPQLRRVAVRGLRVAVIERADGTWAPPALDRFRPTGAPAPGPILRHKVSKLPPLSIEDAALSINRADGSRWTIALGHLVLKPDPLGGAPALNAAGRVAHAGRDLGSFEVDAVVDDPAPRGTVALTNLDLAVLPVEWIGSLRAEGRVSGLASWRPTPGGPAIDLDAVGLDLHVTRTDDAGAAVTWPTARLRAHAAIAGRDVRLTEIEWRSDAFAVAGTAELERSRPGIPLTLDLHGGPLAVAALRDLARLATAPGSPRRANADMLRAGEITAFAVRGKLLPLTGSKEAKARARAAAPIPESLALEATVRGVELHVSDDRPLRDLEGRFSLAGEKLRIEDARATLGDRPLPELSLKLDGITAARTALAAGSVPRSVPALPGLGALDKWIDSLKRPGSPPRWRRIEVRADWIEHPALLRPLEEVTTVLTPANPGIHFEDAKGYWGGVPFSGSGSFYGGDARRIEADVTLGATRRTGRRRADSEAWARARFYADLEKLGDFQAEWLQGVAQAIGDRIELRHGEARLRPRGALAGTLDLDLSHGDLAPYRARIELDDGSMSDLMNDVKMDGGAARGTAEIDVDLNGFVRAGDPPLADMNGTANLRLRSGEINKRMNVLFAIAQASDTLNPFRSRETIPFDTIDAPLALSGGIAKTEALSLQGPAVRMVGTGQVDLVNAPHPVEAVIGVFFFRTLDRMIGMFPLLNRLLLGPDDNLIATYFAVTGPWSSPQGTLIPTKSIASGPASFVLEGLPSFVRGGLATLERVVTGGPTRSEGTPPPPRPSPPPAKEGGAS
jgi:hypothetical protein